MKKYSFLVGILIIAAMQSAFAQEIEMVIVTDEEKIILFSGFIIAIVAMFLYLARDIILRRKSTYDTEDLESKKDRTYEKYHSDWSDDYEELGHRKNYKKDEFKEAYENSTLPNYYKTLEISQDATQEEVKEQYRELAKKSHPDKNKDVSEEIMVDINKAYEILSDKELRKKYDRYFTVN